MAHFLFESSRLAGYNLGMFESLLILAQDDGAAVTAATDAAATASGDPIVTSTPIWQILLENALALTILFIFITSLVTVLVVQRRRDKCLKLLNGFHVNYLSQAGKAMWGDLLVFSKGVEVVFDAPYRTRRGLVKTSSLVYDSELPNCLAICRVVESLTDEQQRRRRRQVRRMFRPNIFRRMLRWCRNLVSMLRDAFSKAISALIGAWATTSKATMVTTQKAGIEQIGQTLLGASGNAYEPILERHIGKPVVIQLQTPASEDKQPVELPGFLADYTEQYLAIFNVDQPSVSDETITVTGDLQKPGYTITWSETSITLTCQGPEPVIVRSCKTSQRYTELYVALVHGCQLQLPTDGGESVELELERTRRLDVVCPRSQAVVYFGGGEAMLQTTADNDSGQADVSKKAKAHGVAPETSVEEADNTSNDQT